MSELADLSLLARYPALQEIDISSTLCSSLAPVGDLLALRQLDISSIRIASLAPPTSPALHKVNIFGADVSDLRPLLDLLSLRKVCLDHRQRRLPGGAELEAKAGVDLVGMSSGDHVRQVSAGVVEPGTRNATIGAVYAPDG
jgi:hypothetical protein